MDTRRDILRRLAAPLESLYGPQEARQTALAAVSALTGIAPAALLADPSAPLDLPGIEPLATELAAGRPLQYVLGFTEFCGLRIGVHEGVLIPRPETEELTLRIAAENVDARHILDIGTGSGCIALALKSLLPQARVYGADLSEKALDTARTNAAALGLEVQFRRADALAQAGYCVREYGRCKQQNADKGCTEDEVCCGTDHTSADRSRDNLADRGVSRGDRPHVHDAGTDRPQAATDRQKEEVSEPSEELFPKALPDVSSVAAVPGLPETFPGRFDVMVSNPPYIPRAEQTLLRRNVAQYEPPEALFVPDEEPLCFYRAIARAANRMLTCGGRLYFETHEHYAEAVCTLLRAEGFDSVELRHDFRGRPRTVRACKIK